PALEDRHRLHPSAVRLTTVGVIRDRRRARGNRRPTASQVGLPQPSAPSEGTSPVSQRIEAMAKNADDWAIIVGIKSYPGISDLDGPRNDALAFLDWSIDENGGGIPREHVELILSPDPLPPGIGADDAQPTESQVKHEFDRIETIAQQNLANHAP